MKSAADIRRANPGPNSPEDVDWINTGLDDLP